MSKTRSESKKKAENKSKPNTIKFSRITKIEKGEKNIINFILENGETINENIESCVKFIDPSYDSVFKTIFNDGESLEGIDGKTRLLDLLNSLIFPTDKNKYIAEIISIGNEKGNITEKYKDNSEILRYDISCKAKIVDNNVKKIIDVEMQFGKKTDIITRMNNYANTLHQTYKLDTILIAFMNQDYISEENRSQFSFVSVYNSEGIVIKEEDNIEVVIVNLKEEIEKYQEKKKIFVKKKELGEIGISWLKLLGIRQWGKTFEDFYYLPKNIEFPSKELESAFNMLQHYDKKQLIKLMRIEEENNNILKNHEEIGKAEGRNEHALLGLINLFKTRREQFDDLIDVVDYQNSTFRNKDIEKNIPNEEEREEFKSFLQKKRKIV